mgnify:CR=1 FL=1
MSLKLLPYDVHVYHDKGDSPVLVKSVCNCDNNPSVIHEGEDSEQYMASLTNKDSSIAMFINPAIAELNHTCNNVCDVKHGFDEIKSFDELIKDEQKKLAQWGVQKPDSTYEDICKCDLKDPMKSQSFKDMGRSVTNRDKEFYDRQLYGPGSGMVEKKFRHATIAKGDKETTCSTQCELVSKLEPRAGVKNEAVVFPVGDRIIGQPEDKGCEIAKYWGVV